MTDTPDTSLPAFATGAINLASARLGAKGFLPRTNFAPLERMLQDVPASFDPELHDDNGKYMDGTHVRYAMHPDGGTMGLRLYGVKA